MARRVSGRKQIGAYVLHRLRLECEGKRGRQAEIARATEFTSAHIAQVLNERTGVGEDFARAMAAFWGMSYAELEGLAKLHSVAEPDVPAVAVPYLKTRPGWEAALTQAKASSTAKKHPYLERAGDAVVPDRELTWELIVRVADLLMATEA